MDRFPQISEGDLTQRPHPDVLWHNDLTSVQIFLPGHDLQQSRLSRSIASHQPDFLAGFHLQPGAFQNIKRAEALVSVADLQLHLLHLISVFSSRRLRAYFSAVFSVSSPAFCPETGCCAVPVDPPYAWASSSPAGISIP